jgi:hypothetical protein
MMLRAELPVHRKRTLQGSIGTPFELLAGLRAASLDEAFEVLAQNRSLRKGTHEGPDLLLAIRVGLASQTVVDPAPLTPVLDDARRAEKAEMT